MKKIILSLSLYFLSSLSFSQTWNIGQQMCIGGSLEDDIQGSLKLSNGNYLLYGTSKSGISGDKTEPNLGNLDIWTIILNPSLQIIVQKTLGGNMGESLNHVIESSDHFLYLVCNSSSGISSTKTDPNFGNNDIWIIKMDINSNIIWDKTIGGDGSDAGIDIVELQSGNFILSSYTNSGISGNKTTPLIGQSDNWILKLDPNGNILWEKTIGGTDYEFNSSIILNGSNEILVSSYSSSNISGDKTENSYGNEDIWLYKMDTNGVIIQDKTIGGSGYEESPIIQKLANGNLLLVCTSDSPISGLKTENNINSSKDCWILELDPNFNIINQKTIGGNKIDYPKTFNVLSNNELLIGMISDSDAGGYKTEARIGNSNKDQWFVKTDSDFNELEDKTIGTPGIEIIGSLLEITPTSFIVFGSSSGANVNDKTCVGNGSRDYWVYKLDTNLGLDEIQNSNINTFPNPVKQELTIETEMDIAAIEIQNLEGKVVATFNQMNQLKTINVQNLITGIYLCKIKMITGQIEVIRFVKE
ncbi:MAG: T9SS type A sorting domain-containing protein [Flavobacteriia bacterium]|nr:T9SS type A sorting domain-containing protein [Flavobacteriia bacterium]